jgi:hypothetical protein
MLDPGRTLGSSIFHQKFREERMTAPTYLIEKIARHGAAVQRLITEMDQKHGEFANHTNTSAVAFDAADFVWAYLALRGDESVQESREVRNRVAEAIIKALAVDAPGHVFENDGSPLGAGQTDGFHDSLLGESGDAEGKIQMSVRDTGKRTLLNLHVPEQLRELFIKRLYGGSLPGEEWPVPITLELSLQPRWITDDKQRASAKRRKETVHLQIPLDEIHADYSDE